MLRKSEEISDAGKQRVAEERKHGFKFSDILLKLHSHPFFFFFATENVLVFPLAEITAGRLLFWKGQAYFSHHATQEAAHR